MALDQHIKHTGLPNTPVVKIDSKSLTTWTAKGWQADAGPETPPTFARPATDTQTVKMQRASLPGVVKEVPWLAFNGPNGWATLGWTLAP